MPQITMAARLPTRATVPVMNVENEEKKLSNGVRMIAPVELSGDACACVAEISKATATSADHFAVEMGNPRRAIRDARSRSAGA